MRTSRLALLCCSGLVAVLATGCSSSSSSSPTSAAAIVASGGVTCTKITGTLGFSPALTSKGTAAESTAITLTASGCTTTGSNVSAVTKGIGSANLSSTTNACAGLLTSRSIAIHITWTPATIRPSVLTFSGYGGVSSPSGGLGFTLPSNGGTATVTGSFAGSDHGAGSTSTAFSSQTGTQLLATCGSPAGLPSVQLTSGTVTLK